MAEQKKTCKVQVTNITEEASNSNISDFFSFCGKIKSLSVQEAEDKTKKAIIEFEKPEATTTAVLLDNAIIINKPISVVLYSAENEKQAEEEKQNQVPTENITQREVEEDESKSSIVRSLISQGYELAHGTLQKAQQLDKDYEISQKINSGYETLKGKAAEYDSRWGVSDTVSKKMNQVNEDYKVSEKVGSFKNTTSEKLNQFNNDYKVSEKASQGVETVKGGFWSGLERLKKDLAKLQEDYPTFASMTEKVSNVIEEVRESINEQNEHYGYTKRASAEPQEEKEEQPAQDVNKDKTSQQ